MPLGSFDLHPAAANLSCSGQGKGADMVTLICVEGCSPAQWDLLTWSTDTTFPTSLNQYDSGLSTFTCST